MVGRQQHQPLNPYSKASISRVVEILKARTWFCCKTGTGLKKAFSGQLLTSQTSSKFYSISNAFNPVFDIFNQ